MSEGRDDGSGGSAADRLALCDLQSAIALATDAGDWVAFLGCFIRGAGVDYGGLGAGAVEELVERIRESQDRYQGTMNVVGTHTAHIEGDRATAQTYVVSHHFRVDAGQSWDDQAGTLYRDEFERTPEGWRVARREADLRWFRSDASATGWMGSGE